MNMTTNAIHDRSKTLDERINALLADKEILILNQEGTLPKTKREYAFWFVQLIDAPKGSVEYKLAKRKLLRVSDALINEHLAVITRIGINNRPNG
jgi:hypothetical protein